MKNWELLFFVLLPLLSNASNDVGFIASFQSSGNWSSNEYLEFMDNITELKEFTACHWEKTLSFSERLNNVWSYCQHLSKSDLQLRCVSVYYYYPSTEGKVSFRTFFQGWSGEKPSFVIAYGNVSYEHQVWNHFCMVYSSISGYSALYHNGKLIRNISLINNTDIGLNQVPSIPGGARAHDSSFIIGQEPDSMRGRFSKYQAFPGNIAELNVWNRPLKVEEIYRIANCLSAKKGNVVMWNASKWKVNEAKITNMKDLSQFCHDQPQNVLFPERLTFKDATKKCLFHGGKIAVPHSNFTNTKLRNIVLEHKEKCSGDNSYEEVIWLGMEIDWDAQKNGDFWHEKQGNGKNAGMNFSNWREFFTAQNHRNIHLCPFSFHDGSWGFGRDKECESWTLCVICSFTKAPLYILKGGQDKTLENLERVYYMSVNTSSNQIEGFNGLSRRGQISFDERKRWYLEDSTLGAQKLTLDDANQPVGRNKWTYGNENDMQTEHLSLSKCQFGKEYTCDSGQCISMSKRCDKMYDCFDNSDEESCEMIEFPSFNGKGDAPTVHKGPDWEMEIITKYIVEKVNFIDTINSRIGLTLSIQMTWKDRRISYKNIHHHNESTLSSTIVKKLWLPLDHSIHANAILGNILPNKKKRVAVQGVHKLPIDLQKAQDDYYFPGINNSLTMKQQFRIQYDCSFNLQKYPFDEQLCTFGLDIEQTEDQRVSLATDVTEAVSYTGPKNVGVFSIVEVTNNLTICLQNSEQRESSTPGFTLCIVIKRSHAAHILSMFCPSILFWILAYFTMFLNIDDIANRSRTSVTLLLVFVALLQAVKKDFPETTYYKYIDIWFIWYIFNIFLISLYHMILPSINLSSRKSPTKKVSPIEIKPDDKQDDTKMHAWNEEMEQIVAVSFVKKINFTLLVFFPLVMILFNVIYFSLTT
jgi:hypothetical protein